MSPKYIYTLIIGAGPSGLAAAHKLTGAGVSPLIVEKCETAGGLMRSLTRGDFTMDVGRKELYTRIPEADQLWRRILGDQYREYPHRVGSLYGGRILEMSGRYRGLRRGLPWSWLVVGGVDLFLYWACSGISRPSNYEGYWYSRAGKSFARLFAQGYWEKFRGQKWADMPVPETDTRETQGSYSFSAIRQGLTLASQGGRLSQRAWRHPAKGTGQICDLMLDEALCRGAQIKFNTKVKALIPKNGRIVEVLTKEADGIGTYRPRHVISSMQIEDLALVLPEIGSAEPKRPNVTEAERSVALVYLFLNEPPRFPHAWLEVNDTKMKSGRITNYAAFNGDMVPWGKTCLCVEFFCVDKDPILSLSPDELKALAVKECAENRLIDSNKLFDTLVVTMRRSNAAASWRDWRSDIKVQLLEQIRRFENLYHVSRPGTDWATFAGMLAAEAVLQGSRSEFDRRADPTRKYSAAQEMPATNDAHREKLGLGWSSSQSCPDIRRHVRPR
jgi:protoporphyrinogen oxidase